METESCLQVLNYSAEELKRKLPGRECALDSSISLLDEIKKHMSEIEEQVQRALINALNSQREAQVLTVFNPYHLAVSGRAAINRRRNSSN